jgi:predicted Zn-dependent protease with MMP-like domain
VRQLLSESRDVDVDPDRFEGLVADALDAVPDALFAAIDNVVVQIEDEPPEDGLLGLYEGVPLTERGSGYDFVLPDRIRIFRRPLLDHCGTEAELVREVTVTVVHEIAHHFGLSDHRLHELGWG